MSYSEHDCLIAAAFLMFGEVSTSSFGPKARASVPQWVFNGLNHLVAIGAATKDDEWTWRGSDQTADMAIKIGGWGKIKTTRIQSELATVFAKAGEA